MAKPIFIVELPGNSFDMQTRDNVQHYLDEKFDDYHILVTTTYSDTIEYKAFFEKDFDEVKYEELKQIVRDNINEIKK